MKINIFPQLGSTRRKGFTLIITISLLVLLTFVALGLLSLSSVTLRTSAQGLAMQEAKANARLSLMLAIGDLQKHLGADQRVTATADQMTFDAGSSSTTANPRKHYLGAYQSWPATEEKRPEPTFVQWFVSGARTDLTNKNWVQSSESGKSIELVGAYTAGEKGDRVEVPALSANLAQSGQHQFAWWVSDLGTKGLISRSKPTANGNAVTIREDTQTMPAYGIGNVSIAGERPFQTSDTTSPAMEGVVTLSNASLITSNYTAVQGLIHDLTTYNRSLMTNVRSGGFRKDLSFHLEKDSANKPLEPLYTVKAGSNSQDGINMSELWLHYNMYKDLKKGGNVTYTTKGAISSTQPYLQLEGSMSSTLNDDEYYYKQPTIIQYQTLLSFRAKPATLNGVEGAYLQIVVDPIITWWNPLDVPVVVSPAYNSIKFWQLPYDITIKTATTSTTANLQNSLGGGEWHYLTVISGKTEPLVLKPGEVLMVSQTPRTALVEKEAKGIANNYFDVVAGWNFGGGIAYYFGGGPKLFLKSGESFTYDVKPNNVISSGSRRWSVNHHEVYYKEDREGRGESIGIGGIYVDYVFGQPNNESNSKPDSARLTGISRPDFFGKIPPANTRRLSFQQLLSRKEPFMLYSYRAKTETGSERPSRFLSRFNPKALMTDFYDLSDDELVMLPFEVQINPLNSFKTPLLEVSTNGNAYFGGGMNAESGNSFVCTHAVPREPIYSLAAMQHAFANGFTTLAPQAGYAVIRGRQPSLPQISHPIGNSFAPSIMAPDATSKSISGPRILADHAYLANRALWDDWYFSSIAPQTGATFTTKRSHKQVLQDWIDGKKDLPLHRYVPALGKDTSLTAAAKLFSGSRLNPNAASVSASLLEVEGMFNVNSTSVEAWKSVLSSLRNRDVITRATSSSGEIATQQYDQTPVSDLNAPLEALVDATKAVDIKEPSQWAGRRTLSDEEIDALARAIVTQVRKRGPFTSLADFVNRRVGTNQELAVSGAIQSALDSPEVPINKGFREGNRAVSNTAMYPFAKAEAGPAATGIPGIVKQGDILTPIAPYLSVRSDSFLIRTCGKKLNASGVVIATAWCEAIVQRKADFLDQTNPITATLAQLTPLNKLFGRRFHLVSFRWLSSNEI